MAVGAPPRQLADFLRSLRAVREFQRKPVPDDVVQDEGRLAERIMLGAWAHGVGSSIGWFSPDGRKEARRLLGVPAKPVLRTASSLGYPVSPPRRGARKPINELVHEERYRA